MAVFSQNLRIYNAERFLESILNSNTSAPIVYMTIGKPTSWDDETTPPEANTSITAFTEVWRYMIGARKITGNDIRQVIPRFDWTSGITYNAYDDSQSSDTMFSPTNPFYVVTDEWNVYKCLSNNNGGISTVKPTSLLTTGAVETSDNYIWKYMYSLSNEERLRFMTPQYIPVKSLTEDNGSLQWQVQENAVDGAIEAIFITNIGSSYTDANNLTVTISGDGSGAIAIPRINTITQSLSSIVLSNPGYGYSFANVTITDSSGIGIEGAARAVISPPGGHGSHPLKELGGSYILINGRFHGTENGKIPTDNELRQIALILNPRKRGSDDLASNSVYSQVTTLTVDAGATSFEEDELVYQGLAFDSATFKGTVISWDNSNNVIKLINVTGVPQADVLNGVTSRAARLVQSVTDNDLEAFSGELLYISNIQPIQRADDQTEDFKIVLQF